MAESTQHFESTFRCAICHNRTGYDDARVLQGIWTCSRCASGRGLRPEAADPVRETGWLEAAYEDRTHLAQE